VRISFIGCVLSIFMCVVCMLSAQIKQTDTMLLKKHMDFLCSDSLAGRKAGSLGEMMAVQYVEDVFAKQKLEFFFAGGYSETFVFSDENDEAGLSRNVAAFVNHKADSTILIIANIDHLGFGGDKSRSYTMNSIHPGADDNASGLSVLLLLPKYLKKRKMSNFNYIILATGAYETGNRGTFSFLKKHQHKLKNVQLVICLHMLGRMSSPHEGFFMVVNPISEVITQQEHVKVLFDKFHVSLRAEVEDIMEPFDKYGFAVVKITTHDDFRKITDPPDKINYSGMTHIAGFIIEMFKK